MFKNKRYITRGISLLAPEFAILPFTLIDTMNVTQKDYLQVFECKKETIKGKVCQVIIHTQEQPPYKKRHVFDFEKPVDTKLFAIDDETHSTLLRADEY